MTKQPHVVEPKPFPVGRWWRVAGVCALLTTVGACVVSMDRSASSSSTPAALSIQPSSVPGATVCRTLALAGLHPDRLAAARVSEAQFSSIIDSLAQHISTHPNSLSTSSAAVLTAKSELTGLTSALRAGAGSAQQRDSLRSALARAQASLTAASADHSAAVAAVRSVVLSQLSDAQRRDLGVALSNRVEGLDVVFSTTERSEADAVALREAAAAVRISGDNAPALARATVASAASSPTAQTAAAGLHARQALRNAWSAVAAQR